MPAPKPAAEVSRCALEILPFRPQSGATCHAPMTEAELAELRRRVLDAAEVVGLKVALRRICNAPDSAPSGSSLPVDRASIARPDGA